MTVDLRHVRFQRVYTKSRKLIGHRSPFRRFHEYPRLALCKNTTIDLHSVIRAKKKKEKNKRHTILPAPFIATSRGCPRRMLRKPGHRSPFDLFSDQFTVYDRYINRSGRSVHSFNDSGACLFRVVDARRSTFVHLER